MCLSNAKKALSHFRSFCKHWLISSQLYRLQLIKIQMIATTYLLLQNLETLIRPKSRHYLRKREEIEMENGGRQS